MDLKRIRYFLAVARSLNFSQAARELDISQPALSKAIKRLEDDFGQTLIRREGRLTHLTQFGRHMLMVLQEVDSAAVFAEEEASRLATTGETKIAIAIMCTIAPGRITKFFSEFHAKHPEIQLVLHDVTAPRIQECLLDGTVDLAIVSRPVEAVERLRIHELFQEEMVLSFPKEHRLAGRGTIAFDRISEFPFLDRLHCEFRDSLMSVIAERKLAMNVVGQSEREDWIQKMVRDGMGVSVLPEGTALEVGLDYVSFSDMNLRRSVYLAIPAGREDNASLRAFVREAKEYCWDL